VIYYPRSSHEALELDALIAILTIGDEAAIDLLGKTLARDLDTLAVKTDDKGRQSLDGRQDRAQRIISLLGLHQHERAVPPLVVATRFLDEHPEIAKLFEQERLAEALLQHKEAAREIIAQQVEQGDYLYLRLLRKDPYYLPSVRKLIFAPETSAGLVYASIRYLWNVGTPEALATLREVYEKQIQRDDPRTHFELCQALAALGDDRGLTDAYDALTELYQNQQPPQEKETQDAWKDRRKSLEEGAKRVLDRVQRGSIENFVKTKSDSANAAQRRALIELLWRLPETPKSIVPALEGWKNEANTELSQEIARLLERER
jgi:hypothetical protein